VSWLELIGTILKFAFSLWSYFRGEADERAKALKAIAEQFAALEAKGYPIMTQILSELSRQNWVDWKEVPASQALPKEDSHDDTPPHA
jgi:hypothetical protein